MRTILLITVLFLTSLDGQITERNLRFVDYPGFPDAHSTWGSIGYNPTDQKVFIGVTNHRNRQGLYEYDVRSGSMRLCGFVADLAHLREFQWQGKVHTQIVPGSDGSVYFATDGGESREEYLMEHPQGYRGGMFFKWDPREQRLTNLGMGLEYDSIKDLAVDPNTGQILAVSYPQVHLLLYDPARNDLQDLGRMGSDHVPRIIFSDWWNNVYYVDWRQRLVKYERATKTLLFARDSLPAFEGTPGERIVTGITAYAIDKAAGTIYLVTYGSKMLAFRPQQMGIGPVTDLGGIFDGEPPYQYYCPNLGLAKNGRLHYFLGGHGMYAGRKGEVALMEFDPKTRVKKALLWFPDSVISEATGSDVRDAEGNLYFAGRRDAPHAETRGESGASKPFMIMFNPGKELR